MARKSKPPDPRSQLDLFAPQGELAHRGLAPKVPVPDPERVLQLPPSPTGLPEGWRLETNLAAFAGAGSGKTYGLVTCALHVLAGARAGKEPIAPSALCMLAFTEKAAGEMRERLLERLELLADGADQEKDLRQSFDALGRPFPAPAFFRQVRDGLGAAFIGTFHALCIQLLKQAPPGVAGIPGFTLIDERAARA
jgi:ATP-dependent exoDNAse (exonuclease V) beta subunit